MIDTVSDNPNTPDNSTCTLMDTILKQMSAKIADVVLVLGARYFYAWCIVYIAFVDLLDFMCLIQCSGYVISSTTNQADIYHDILRIPSPFDERSSP